ncbi:MAG: hypothetical protein N3A66_03260, partial [Planctomycetota bacterium]|nr:hypothetical protein [Planctomycetota bacterium]
MRFRRLRRAAAAVICVALFAWLASAEERKEKPAEQGATPEALSGQEQEAKKNSGGWDKDWTRQGPILEPPPEASHRRGVGGQIEFGEIAA